MKTIKYTWWQDGQFFLGFLNEYPDYLTQAYSKDELLENLKSLLEDIESNHQEVKLKGCVDNLIRQGNAGFRL
jgi:predicted RNase H-like HicB family nuclease